MEALLAGLRAWIAKSVRTTSIVAGEGLTSLAMALRTVASPGVLLPASANTYGSRIRLRSTRLGKTGCPGESVFSWSEAVWTSCSLMVVPPTIAAAPACWVPQADNAMVAPSRTTAAQAARGVRALLRVDRMCCQGAKAVPFIDADRLRHGPRRPRCQGEPLRSGHLPTARPPSVSY